MKSNLQQYIKETSTKVIKEQKQFNVFGNVQVVIKDPLPESLDLAYVFDKIDSIIPDYLKSNIDLIYIGEFSEFLERDVNAMYKHGALYITNAQDDEADMIDDIVHEIAHSVEEFAGQDIYGDKKVENEFIGKREKLFYILREEGFDVNLQNFLNSSYDKDFDKFLYDKIGYPLLISLTMGLFISPYAVTSLREYFASGFERYFLGDRRYLNNISPLLYNRLEYISNF